MGFEISSLVYTGLQGFFYILLLLFSIHTIFLAYHWFKYGSSRTISLSAFAVYLAGSAVLLLTYSLALNALSL
jgi:hypothetical protein